MPATHAIVKLGEEGHLKRRGVNNENFMYTPAHTHVFACNMICACNYISVSQGFFRGGTPKVILLCLEELLPTKKITDQKNKREAVVGVRRLLQNSELLNKISRGISEVIWNFSRHFRFLVCLVYDFLQDPGWETLMYNVFDEDANQDHTARLETCSPFWSIYSVANVQKQ
jgi:hypothetical protein